MARLASGREAVPPAADDPLSAGRLAKYTVADFMLLLALAFGKCQNQVPRLACTPVWQATLIDLNRI